MAVTEQWYVEITWHKDQPVDLGIAEPHIEGLSAGGWRETEQSTAVLRGDVQVVLAWIMRQLGRGRLAVGFRAMPFEHSPLRGMPELVRLREVQATLGDNGET
jgi:hypothetical protein